MQLQKGNEYEVSKSQQLILASGLVGTGFMKENRSGLEVNQTFLYYHILRGTCRLFPFYLPLPVQEILLPKVDCTFVMFNCIDILLFYLRYPHYHQRIDTLPPKKAKEKKRGNQRERIRQGKISQDR